MGLILAALRAGMSPATVPATIIRSVACTQTPMPTVGSTNICNAKITSERKPKWWSVALDVCGLALAALNIAKTERMQKGRHNIG